MFTVSVLLFIVDLFLACLNWLFLVGVSPVAMRIFLFALYCPLLVSLSLVVFHAFVQVNVQIQIHTVSFGSDYRLFSLVFHDKDVFLCVCFNCCF